VNETFQGELRGLVFQNLFLEELDGDEDGSRAAVPRQVKKGCQQMGSPKNHAFGGIRTRITPTEA